MNVKLAFAFTLLFGALLFSRADASPVRGEVFTGQSLIVKIKNNKHENDNGGDRHHKKQKDKSAKNPQPDESPPENQGSKDAKTTTTPDTATTNQNVLWGDYMYQKKH